jgi:lauroyl/myristoyl acyltransferase
MDNESQATGNKKVQHGPFRRTKPNALREDFFELFVRSYRIAEKQGTGLTVYHSCADLVGRLFGEPWFAETIFPKEFALVRRFLGEAGLSQADPDAVARLNLMANTWAFAWTAALQDLDPPRFASVCSVAGESILRSALARGRGVICAHYHTPFAPLFSTWLEHSGIAPGVLIREWVKTRHRDAASDRRTQAIEGARELKSALDTLRQGGITHVMADGHAGSHKTVLPFCNRQRGFETTFATLALMTGAPIITVAARFHAGARIRIEIGPAFTDDPALSRTARIERLLRQFVTHLHRHWTEHPADIPWFQMITHLALPPIALRDRGGPLL